MIRTQSSEIDICLSGNLHGKANLLGRTQCSAKRSLIILCHDRIIRASLRFTPNTFTLRVRKGILSKLMTCTYRRLTFIRGWGSAVALRKIQFILLFYSGSYMGNVGTRLRFKCLLGVGNRGRGSVLKSTHY